MMLLLIFSTGCNRTKKYALQGEVVAKNPTTGEITVNHGDIPGFMPAMAMPYRVKDPAVVQELQPGDRIATGARFILPTSPGKHCSLPSSTRAAPCPTFVRG